MSDQKSYNDQQAYQIMGKYRGKVEEVDTATGERDADYLVGEYRLAFGRDWEIWKQTSTEEN
jgi:hypothetical protein